MENIKKSYPPAVVLRKNMVIIAGIVLLVVATIILINLYRSAHPTQKAITLNSANANIATSKDGIGVNTVSDKWYKHLEIKKTVQNKLRSTVDTNSNDGSDEDDDGDKNNENKNDDRDDQDQSTQLNTSDNSNKFSHRSIIQELEELKRAMSASINSNQIIGGTDSETSGNNKNINSNQLNRRQERLAPSWQQQQNHQSRSDKEQNLQHDKKAFLKFNNQSDDAYLREELKNPLSIYELKAGSVIPAILITGINSDLPGQITAQVRSNVYDSIAGKHLVIPQGAKLTGLYDSQIVYGQQRVLVVWKRIIFPNGQSISLEGMPGVDMSGYAGFNDQVDNHYFRIFGSVILMSAISAGAQLSQPQQSSIGTNGQLTVNQTLAASLGTNIMNTVNMLTQKNIGIQPTLIIRPGYLFNISVTKDIIFPGEYTTMAPT